MEKDLKIFKSKTLADGSKYFSLFEKHIPELNSGSGVYLYMLGNLSCICEIIQKNPNAKYFIYDSDEVFNAVRIVMDGYDISKTVDVYDIDMKFDCIIMNPPYQKNLHLKILAEAIKHLKDDNSKVVNLSPTPWLAKFNIKRPFAKYRYLFNGFLNNITFVGHDIANSLFGTGNSIEELGVYEMNGSKQSNLDLLKYGFESELEYNLYCKIDMMDNSNNKLLTFNRCRDNDLYGCMCSSSKPMVRKQFDVPVYTWHGGNNCRDAVVINHTDKKVSMVLYFNSNNERENFLNSLDTTFMNWYYRMFVVPGDYKIKNYMFRMADYSQPWTDERFKEFFKLTDEEWKYIEDTMAKYAK